MQVKELSNNFQVNSFTQPDTQVRHVALSDQREKRVIKWDLHVLKERRHQ